MSTSDLIDVIAPPTFTPTGITKTIDQAIADGEWVGGIHIWIYTRNPEPAVLLQVRSKQARIAPNKLDVTAAGHYDVGEQGLDGLRELREELGIDVSREDCVLWGTRLFADVDSAGRERKFALATYTTELEKIDINHIVPQVGEVEGVFLIPLKPLLKVLNGQQVELAVNGIDDAGQSSTYVVKGDAFYHNPDNYHLHLLEHIAYKLNCVQ